MRTKGHRSRVVKAVIFGLIALFSAILAQSASFVQAKQPSAETSSFELSLFDPSLFVLSLFDLSLRAADESKHDSLTAVHSSVDGTIATDLRFVTGQNIAIANAVVRVLCYADEQATTLLFETQLTTDIDGYPLLPLPVGCPWIVALHRQYEQPSGKTGHGPAYEIYATSWRTSSGTPDYDAPGCSYGVPNCAIARLATGEVTIRKEWPLILFNVVASLEWEPEKGSKFVEELRIGLKYASLYLADLTDGYMALGTVSIYTGGRSWDGADLRFQTANDLRPAAFIGGMVDGSHLFTAPTTGQSVVLRPAATFYGRYWDGDNAYTGAWNQPDAYRTLIHEWAHYALFLYDEYGHVQGRLGSMPTYCVCNDLPQLLNSAVSQVCNNVDRENGASAMAFHYVASELWHPIHGTPSSCANSDQAHFHGEPDRFTLRDWYKGQTLLGTPHLPPLLVPSALVPGPSVLQLTGPTADLFGLKKSFNIHIPFLNLPVQLVTNPVFTSELHVKLSDSASPTKTLVSQIYLSQNDATDTIQHVLHQGTLIGAPTATDIGSLELWGLTEDDTFQVFVDRYRTSSISGGRFVYSSEKFSGPQPLQTVTAAQNTWGSSIDIVYVTSVPSGDTPGQLVEMIVFLTGPHTLDYSTPPRAQICVPDAKIGCPKEWNQSMQLSNNRWVASFVPLPGVDELPLYGTVQILSQKERRDNLIRWFRDAGGVGPGHKIGNAAPIRDGLVMVDRIEDPDLETSCNRVMVMPAADYDALNVPMDAEALVSPPLDLDILFGNDVNGQCTSSGKTEMDEFKPLRLTLFYNEDAVQRLGIADESQLKILQYVPELKEWAAAESAVDVDLNRVSTSISEDGIYAIGWYP